MSAIRINRNLEIPEHELEFRFTPSGGPGGQHANKAATRVELVWNIAGSSALDPRQRQRLMTTLRNRIDGNGNLRLASDRQRSQIQNRHDVVDRFATLIRRSLVPPKKRVETKPSKAAKEKRLAQKKHRSDVKKNRKVRLDDL